jgi:hypothetical protein
VLEKPVEKEDLPEETLPLVGPPLLVIPVYSIAGIPQVF